MSSKCTVNHKRCRTFYFVCLYFILMKIIPVCLQDDKFEGVFPDYQLLFFFHQLPGTLALELRH